MTSVKHVEQQGFLTFLRFLTGRELPGNYVGKFRKPTYRELEENPLNDGNRLVILGTWGLTSSLGDLLGAIRDKLFDDISNAPANTPIVKFLVYKVKTQEGREVVLGFKTSCDSTYLSYGFTDFSGEGNRGRKMGLQVFQFLSDLYGIQIVEHETEDLEPFDKILAQLQKKMQQEL